MFLNFFLCILVRVGRGGFRIRSGGNVVVLEGGASGYWTTPVTRSSGIQPLGFDSLTLRGHSDFVILIDKRPEADSIELTGVVQYHSKPRGILGAWLL